MIKSEFIRNIDTSIKQFRNSQKTNLIQSYKNEIPYVSIITLYKGPLSGFEHIMDFYANVPRDSENDPVWKWQELTPEDWADMPNDDGESFGKRSTFNSLKKELKAVKVSNAHTFTQGWRMWENWDTTGDDDIFTLACLAQTKENYVFFGFKGFVIH